MAMRLAEVSSSAFSKAKRGRTIFFPVGPGFTLSFPRHATTKSLTGKTPAEWERLRQPRALFYQRSSEWGLRFLIGFLMRFTRKPASCLSDASTPGLFLLRRDLVFLNSTRVLAIRKQKCICGFLIQIFWSFCMHAPLESSRKFPHL